MQPVSEVVISHYAYTEPSFIGQARERGFTREHRAHDALAAAKAAAVRPFTLRDLPDLLANINASDLDVIYDEVQRLRAVEDTYLNTLATAAWHEAGKLDPTVLRPVRALAENLFIPWAGGSDAPAGNVMTWVEARAAGFPEERLLHAVEMTPTQNAFNRAGPGEACLTVAAIIEAYASDEARQAFRLTPEKVQPYTTSEMGQNPATGEWEHSDPYWVPWAPDQIPAALPPTMKETF